MTFLMDTAGWKKSKLTTYCVNKEKQMPFSQQKQDQVLNVAEIKSSLQNYHLNKTVKPNNQTNNLQHQQYFILF